MTAEDRAERAIVHIKLTTPGLLGHFARCVIADEIRQAVADAKEAKPDCQSCGGDLGSAPIDDYRCHGCGMIVCTPCVTVFGHLRDGPHGLGDWQEAVEMMQKELSHNTGEASQGIPEPSATTTRAKRETST